MRVLSGIQPSGRLHLGNYFGAMKPQLALQKDSEPLYFIASYHALTTVHDPHQLRALTVDVAMDYLALGLDPEVTTLFRQQDVPQVTELAWILSCVTPMGFLERAVSYKDKVAQGLFPNHGLFAYPVLQAADILIYLSEVVPVGQDQRQHIEITRDIANKFNQEFGEVFVVPESRIIESTAIIPGTDGRKMSKSYGNEIGIFEEGTTLRNKVMGIVTDSSGIDEPKDPHSSTPFLLLRMLASAEETAEWERRYVEGGMGFGEVKKRLLELIQETLAPAREKRRELERDPGYVEDVLTEGGKRARSIARPVMERVRELTGLPISYKPV